MKNWLNSITLAILMTGMQILPTLATPRASLIAQGPGNHGGSGSSLYVCTHNGNGTLNLRSGPGQGFNVIRQISNGSAVNPVDSGTGSDGYLWHKVNYRGSVGWVRGDYLCS